MQTEPEKELIHLLPIKDKRGIIPQTMEKPGEAQSRLPGKLSVWFKNWIIRNAEFLKSLLFLVVKEEEEEEEMDEIEEMEEAQGI